jgi:hypothetical protein
LRKECRSCGSPYNVAAGEVRHKLANAVSVCIDKGVFNIVDERGV